MRILFYLLILNVNGLFRVYFVRKSANHSDWYLYTAFVFVLFFMCRKSITVFLCFIGFLSLLSVFPHLFISNQTALYRVLQNDLAIILVYVKIQTNPSNLSFIELKIYRYINIVLTIFHFLITSSEKNS